MANVGKPLSIIDFEFDLTVDNLRFFAGAARTMETQAAGEYMEDHTSMLRRDPLGVVAGIAPWNYPLNMAVWKFGPALAAGNTFILKPSELTPLSALRLAELTEGILPPGVFNVVTGKGETAGDAIVRHPGIAMLSLTGDVNTGKLIARNAEAFSELMASDLTDRRRNDLWQPITIGSDESGELVSLVLPEHNLLLGGEPGSGKSVALSVLIANAALDPTVSISLLDGKQVELAAWSDIAEHLVGPDQEAAIEVLEALVETMSERYETLLRERRRKIAPDGGFGIHLVVIDELAFYLRGGTKPLRDRFGELLRDLVSRGRAAGIVVIAATQKPSHDIVPTFIRDLFAYRLAMRCSSTDASDTILGSGWAQRECSAASIDPGQRGVGYLLAEGGVPVLIKTPYLDDAEIELIARQSEALRGLR